MSIGRCRVFNVRLTLRGPRFVSVGGRFAPRERSLSKAGLPAASPAESLLPTVEALEGDEATVPKDIVKNDRKK